MITKKVMFSLVGSAFLLSSCVSSKVYNELEGKYQDLQAENRELSEDLGALREENTRNSRDLADLRGIHEQVAAERDRLDREYNAIKSRYDNLVESYDALEQNSSSALAENSRRNRELLGELESKEDALRREQERLEKLQRDLAARSQRVDELEGKIAAQEAKMNNLRETLSRALVNFEGRGLTVEQRDGKVYVSMENKLLFSSGSWAVGSEGSQAVRQLGEVLAQNPDISVLIEGHTDDVPYRRNNQIYDNWDLSMKRATSIVRLLQENSEIDPENLTAAGRGEYSPVASNETAEGKASNRRIEVILTPKLDEINRLLDEL